MPSFRPVYLAIVMGLGALTASGQDTASSPPVRAIQTQAAPGSGTQSASPQSSPSPTPVDSPPVVPAPVQNAPEPQPPAASAPPIATPNLNALQGLPVVEVHINSAAVQDSRWLEQLIPQKAGEPLDKYKVRRSVQVLYDTGRFAEIEVQAEATPRREVVLTFAARENYFFGSLRAQGSGSRPTDSQLVNASRLTLGELFTEEKIQSGMQSMQRTLQENGFYQATIKPFYEWDSRNQQVKVLFQVEKGKPARVGHVNVSGDPGMSAEEVRSVAGLHSGQKITAGKLNRALQKIRKNYQKQERLEAQVALTQRLYHPDSNTLDYSFEISRGPVVDVRVEGVKMRRGVIKKVVPVYEENAVDEDLLNEGSRAIRNYLQSKGYFDTQVTYELREQPNTQRQDVVYRVERHERHKFVDLQIEGNHYFSRDEIRERMQMQPAGGLIRYGLFSQAILTRDVQAIQSLYVTNGFRQVKIASQVQDNYGGKKGRLRVVLSISEGPQTTVGKLTIEGNKELSNDEVRALVSSTEGQPYSDAAVINDQTQVMDAYFNRGFPQVKFDYSTLPEADDPNRIDVTYRISEGSQVFVDKVLTSGLHYTRPSVVDHQMKIETGQPLSQQKMLDSQSRLYDMGIFNEVTMAVQNPDGDATRKNLNFQLSEARRYTFNYGVGLEVQTGQPGSTTNPQGETGVSPRVSFDVTRLNFRGRNHTLTLKTRYGNLEKLALIGWEAPRLFDTENLLLNFTTFYEQTNDVKTFTAKRLEGSAQVKHNLDRATTLIYRMIYRRVSTDNLVIDPNLVPLFSRPVRVGMPDFSYLRNTRDNDFESQKGAFNTFDLGIASGVFGSQASFSRLILQNSTYHQFHKRRWVFARSTRIGVEEPFGQTDFVPLPERFFAGGPTSHRGFGINQAGPRDLTTGFPLGGEALFINNLELRTPPLPLPWVGNNVSGVVFHDMGNVFSTGGDMARSLVRFAQPGRASCLNPGLQACSFSYMSHAVGAGVRYRTPVGPVSFDLGYNLNPPAFPVSAPPPPAVPNSQVLRHFNFFFNIGQTF